MKHLIRFMKGVVIHLAQARLLSGLSTSVSEQIKTRFGALDSRLAIAVRHALDVAVTFTALTRLNDVHLRIAAMAGIVDANLQIGEPPSHNWREFIIDIFGRNQVSTRRSPVGLRMGGPNAISQKHLDFAASYRPSPQEHGTVHDLVAAASAFVVAEATGLAELLDNPKLALRESCPVDDMIVTLQHVGQVGVRLAEVAAEGNWTALLTDRLMEDVPVPMPRPVEMSSTASLPTHDRDHVVLMVDPMKSSHQRALTRQALVTLRESMARRADPAPPTLVVMSTVSSLNPVPVDLVMDNKAERRLPVRDSDEWFTRTLDRVSRAVETFNHQDTTPRRSCADPIKKREQPFESIHTAVRHYQPLMLIVLANSTSMNDSDRYLVSLNIGAHKCASLIKTADTDTLKGVSVAVISFSPPEVGLRSLVKAWFAAGAGKVQYQCLNSGDADENTSAGDYFAEAPYATRQRTRELIRVDEISPRFLKSRLIVINAVFVIATVLTIVTVLTWGIHAASNIFGLAIGLSSGAALAWSARQWAFTGRGQGRGLRR